MNIDRKKYLFLSVLVILYSLLLRLIPPLDKYGLNMMEIDYIRWITDLNGYDFLVNCVANHHGFLSPALLDIWISFTSLLTNNIDQTSRLLSVLLFIMTMVVILLLRDNEIDMKIKIFAAFFVSINGLMIALSRNARLLPLFALLVFLMSFFFYKGIKEYSSRNSIMLFIISLLAFINHPLSLIYAIALFFGAIFVWGIKKDLFRSLLPLIFALIIVSPYYIWLFKYGRAETELLPFTFKILSKWVGHIFGDYMDIIIVGVLLIATHKISDLSVGFKQVYSNRLIRFFIFSLLIGSVIFILISLFLPLTREYYILPLILYFSFIIGSFLVSINIKLKTIIVIIFLLGTKAFISYTILDKQIYKFHFTYGYEKTVLNNFRESSVYKEIDIKNSVFLNLPIYHTRAFEYYKTKDEEYLPQLDKYGYVEEIINIEDVYRKMAEKKFYLILWDDCLKLKDNYHRHLCNSNLENLGQIFQKEIIWKYDFFGKKVIKVYKLSPRS